MVNSFCFLVQHRDEFLALFWLYILILFALEITRIFLIHKAVQLTKQPQQMKNSLNYFYRLTWLQYLHQTTLGFIVYFYDYFFKTHWKFRNYFDVFMYILINVILGIGLRNSRYHIRRLESHLIQKLRDHVKTLKHNQELVLQDVSKPSKSNINTVETVVEITKCDIQVPFHILESRIISPLDIIINDKDPIGQGMFGIVHKGLLLIDGIRNEIVLKAAKHAENPDTFQMLIQEIKIIIHAGDHPNIIKCFGVTSDATLNYRFSIVNEHCPNGSLKDFLENERVNFEFNQNHNTSVQNNYVHLVCSLELKHLFQFASEICLGMEHLASKKVIHGDLAARNVLLSNTLQVKITDFGMSRRLYNYQIYSQLQEQALLPWRWMSIETMEDLKVSEKSDVWSFGVTLWEIFTLGDLPYEGLDWNLDIPQRLRNNGLRLEKPPWAKEQMYEIMMDCWKVEYKQRPNFQQLRLQIQNLQYHRECHNMMPINLDLQHDLDFYLSALDELDEMFLYA